MCLLIGKTTNTRKLTFGEIGVHFNNNILITYTVFGLYNSLLPTFRNVLANN